MKFLFFVFLVFLVVGVALAEGDFKPKTAQDIRSYSEECLKKYPVSLQQLAKMWALNFPNLPTVRKHMTCVIKSIGIYVPDKGYDVDRMVNQFNVDSGDSDLVGHIKSCVKDLDGKDEAQDVYDGFMCTMDSKLGGSYAAEVEPGMPDNVREIVNGS